MIKAYKKGENIVIEVKGSGEEILTLFGAIVMDLIDNDVAPIELMDRIYKLAVIKSKKGIEAASKVVKDMADFYKDLIRTEDTADED